MDEVFGDQKSFTAWWQTRMTILRGRCYCPFTQEETEALKGSGAWPGAEPASSALRARPENACKHTPSTSAQSQQVTSQHETPHQRDCDLFPHAIKGPHLGEKAENIHLTIQSERNLPWCMTWPHVAFPFDSCSGDLSQVFHASTSMNEVTLGTYKRNVSYWSPWQGIQLNP